MVTSGCGHAVAVLAVQISSVHHRMPDRGGQWGIAVLLLGVVLVCRGTLPLVRLRRWRARASWARGRVVDHVSASAGRRRAACSPIIEFDADGTTVMFRSPTTGSLGRFPLGAAVEVLYDRADPRRAGLADTGWALPWSLIIGIGVVGVFFAVTAS
jgi:hypothetical protein